MYFLSYMLFSLFMIAVAIVSISLQASASLLEGVPDSKLVAFAKQTDTSGEFDFLSEAQVLAKLTSDFPSINQRGRDEIKRLILADDPESDEDGIVEGSTLIEGVPDAIIVSFGRKNDPMGEFVGLTAAQVLANMKVAWPNIPSDGKDRIRQAILVEFESSKSSMTNGGGLEEDKLLSSDQLLEGVPNHKLLAFAKNTDVENEFAGFSDEDILAKLKKDISEFPPEQKNVVRKMILGDSGKLQTEEVVPGINNYRVLKFMRLTDAKGTMTKLSDNLVLEGLKQHIKTMTAEEITLFKDGILKLTEQPDLLPGVSNTLLVKVVRQTDTNDEMASLADEQILDDLNSYFKTQSEEEISDYKAYLKRSYPLYFEAEVIPGISNEVFVKFMRANGDPDNTMAELSDGMVLQALIDAMKSRSATQIEAIKVAIEDSDKR